MANVVTLVLQNRIKSFVSTMLGVQLEAKELYHYYFNAGVSTDIDLLSTDATAATTTTKLTKAEVVNGVTLIGELNDFFANAAVTQADYYATLLNLLNGNDQRLSTPAHTEAFANRLNALALTLIDQFKAVKEILELYIDSGMSSDLSGLPDERIVYGAEMTKAELSSGVTVIEQFKKMINNETVTTGDYGATLASWQRLL